LIASPAHPRLPHFFSAPHRRQPLCSRRAPGPTSPTAAAKRLVQHQYTTSALRSQWGIAMRLTERSMATATWPGAPHRGVLFVCLGHRADATRCAAWMWLGYQPPWLSIQSQELEHRWRMLPRSHRMDRIGWIDRFLISRSTRSSHLDCANHCAPSQSQRVCPLNLRARQTLAKARIQPMANGKPAKRDPRTDSPANSRPKPKEPANRVRMLKDQTPQQRAARITYHLALHALAGLEGLTTSQIAAIPVNADLGMPDQSMRARCYPPQPPNTKSRP
jgi:hypothetical protein